MKSEDKARAAITTLREGFKALDFQRVCSELLILPEDRTVAQTCASVGER